MERGDTGLGRDAYGLPRRERDRRGYGPGPYPSDDGYPASEEDDAAGSGRPVDAEEDDYGQLLRRPGEMPPRQQRLRQPGRPRQPGRFPPGAGPPGAVAPGAVRRAPSRSGAVPLRRRSARRVRRMAAGATAAGPLRHAHGSGPGGSPGPGGPHGGYPDGGMPHGPMPHGGRMAARTSSRTAPQRRSRHSGEVSRAQCPRTVPRIAVPRIAVPRIAVPRIAVPRIAVPRIAVPRIAVPRIAVRRVGCPRIAVPRMRDRRTALSGEHPPELPDCVQLVTISRLGHTGDFCRPTLKR